MRRPGRQHENRSAAKFCEEWAAPLPRTCFNCGSALSKTAKFCVNSKVEVTLSAISDIVILEQQGYVFVPM